MIEFNNSQRLGLDLDRHIALDAGAGTGKTTVMAERYVQHLLTTAQRATLGCHVRQGAHELHGLLEESHRFLVRRRFTVAEVVVGAREGVV